MAIRYEWDPAKAAANRAKHGVSFEIARAVFKDPLAIIDLDPRDDYGEDRLTIIGMAGSRLLFVVFTEKNAGALRIISARKVTANEKRAYHEASR